MQRNTEMEYLCPKRLTKMSIQIRKLIAQLTEMIPLQRVLSSLPVEVYPLFIAPANSRNRLIRTPRPHRAIP